MSSDNDAPDDLPAPNFPATSELVSGHDAALADSEALDARAFAELERCKLPWSWVSESPRGT